MKKNRFKSEILNFGLLILLFINSSIYGQAPSNLMTADYNFAVSDHVVSTSFFHWFSADGGQISGPWKPVEGRANWTGDVEFWKRMIKQTMDANIDVFYVELIPQFEQSRINLYQALNELRMQGWDVPKVCPFFDPMVTCTLIGHSIDVGTAAGKDELASYYISFYEEYYSKNTDTFADDYIYTLDGKVVLNTWHVHLNLTNYKSLTRADLASRLSAHFGTAHPIFNNGIRMITTATTKYAYSFADEQVYQFQITQYYKDVTFNGITSAQLKPGYWDENVRNPGSILLRNGGVDYKNAWNTMPSNVSRINVESFNEYDEGSGIYAASTAAPYLTNGNTHTDTWSSTNDPYEYIKTTAIGAAKFNGNQALNAKILWNNIPDIMYAGETYLATVVVRNTGNEQWNNANGFKFGEQEANDPVLFGSSRYLIDDTKDDIPEYGGIFRGRTKTFKIQIVVPQTLGSYVTHWGMLKEGVAWYGETVSKTIQVVNGVRPPSNILADFNGDFEWGLTNWRFFEVPSSVGSTAVITSDAISGTKAVKVTYLDGASVADRGFDNWDAHPPVTGGQGYNMKVFLKSDQASGLITRMTLGFFDGAGTFVGQKSIDINLTTTYTEYSLQTTAPSNAAYCFIALRTMNASGNNVAGTMYVDNMQLYPVSTDPNNLLSSLNGDFELGNTSNWRYIKIDNGGYANLTAPMSTTDVHGGTFAAQINWPGAYSGLVESLLDQDLPSTAGEQFTYKAWAKLVSGPAFMLRMHCTYWTAGGSLAGDYNDQTWIVSSSSYSEHVWTIPVAPAGTARINVGFRAFNADGGRWSQAEVVCLIDDVQLIKSTVLTGIISSNEVKCSIYPNPATGVINLMSDKAIKTASIYNMSGQKVKEIYSDFAKISISNLHSGIYFVKMLTLDGESTQKLVIK